MLTVFGDLVFPECFFDEHPDFKDRPHVIVSDCFDQGWTLVIEGQNDGCVSWVNAVINVQMGQACPGAHLFKRDFQGEGLTVGHLAHKIIKLYISVACLGHICSKEKGFRGGGPWALYWRQSAPKNPGEWPQGPKSCQEW